MAVEPTPRASVIIVTRDREQDLARALDSLGAQGDGFEVIVVDDGSRDGTWELLAARRGVVAIRHERPRGPGPSRNDAARQARAPVLVFLDSDCRALPGWLDAMLAPLDDPSVGAVGGEEVLDPEEPLRGRVFHYVLTAPLATGRLRGGTGGRAGRYRPRSFSLAVRRADFERVGGFSALFLGEDLDLDLRLERLGLRLVHAREARVHHRRRRSWPAFARQVFGMGRARATLVRRDRGHLEAVYLLPGLALLSASGLAAAAALAPAVRAAALVTLAAALAFLAVLGRGAALRLRAVAALVLAPLAFVLAQAAYGAGFLAGFLVPVREGS